MNLKFGAILFTVSAFLSALSYGQTHEAEVADTIVRLGGRKIICAVLLVSANEVTYREWETQDVKAITRKNVEKILYKGGRVEIFNKPVLQMIDESQWQAVLVTQDQADVEGLYKRGIISAKSSPSTRSRKAARQSATIRLQKKAANIGGSIILLMKAEAKGAYGDMPGYYMEGIAYGFEPLEDGTNVITDKDPE
jgi:hypothetical protein